MPSQIMNKKGNVMNSFQYEVVKLDGDYAYLRRLDLPLEQTENEELKMVARALLPPEISEGTKLLYEWLQYSILQQPLN